MITLRVYQTVSDRAPFSEWFDALDARAAARITSGLARMERGNFGDVKSVGAGVSERRFDFGPGYRVYFGRDGDNLVILLAGGSKARQQEDIVAAKTAWADYRQRKG